MHSIGKNTALLGILGGLGPLSSAYFYELITRHTDASCDQEHIDIILSSRATTPDRTDYILGKSKESPLPYMIEDARLLERYGADAIVIPCNTAHYFIEEVRRSVSVPVPSIITETAEHIKRCGYHSACILATEGTVLSGSYQSELERLGIRWAVPDESDQAIVSDIIYNGVKNGENLSPDRLLELSEKMFRRGCDCAILGCTELSVLKRSFPEDMRFVDSLEALAYKAITMFNRNPTGFTPDYDNSAVKR